MLCFDANLCNVDFIDVLVHFGYAKMEELFLRFPHVGESVCKFLDDESLMELKEVSRISKSSIENQRHSWVRIIHESNCGYLGDGFPESWISILTKSPIEIVKQIGIEFNQLEECVDIEAFQLRPLDFAAVSGNLSLFQMIYNKMLEKNPKQILNVTESFREAAYRGHYDICRFILRKIEKKVLDVNPKHEDNGKTILHYAVEDGYFEIYKLVMNNVEDKNPSNDGETPFHSAASRGNLNFCKLIAKNIGKEYPRDDEGRTPLHNAGQFGHFEVCRYLLKKFEDKNPRSDITGWTALHAAAASGDATKYQIYNVCKLIIDQVSDKNPRDLNGDTPLHGAAFTGNLRLYKYLSTFLSLLDKNPENNRGITPLHWAVQYGYLNLCKFIMKKVADKNPKDANGNTALHFAAFGNGRLEIYKYIMNFVKDKNPKNTEGNTPLHYVAIESKNVALAKLILENIDEKNPQNDEGHTLLFYAMDKVEKCIKDAISAKGSDTGNMEDHILKPQIKQTTNHANPSNQDDNGAPLASYRDVGRSENPGVPVSFGGHNLPLVDEIGLTDLTKEPTGTAGLSYESDPIEATILLKKKKGFLSKVRGFFGSCLLCCCLLAH